MDVRWERAVSDNASLQLGGIAALYLLWCATWLVLGDQVFGPAHLSLIHI